MIKGILCRNKYYVLKVTPCNKSITYKITAQPMMIDVKEEKRIPIIIFL